jgi:translation elongation factor EF-Ts
MTRYRSEQWQREKVGELSDRTGLSPIKCIQLLEETNFDIEKAVQLARIKYPMPKL